ncbi:30S ribosomal protein S6 [Candidatus Nomurabacteria bacterium]|nr:30S ribosomal protein S6 [Candidatus Nomurabacteria bacterium]
MKFMSVSENKGENTAEGRVYELGYLLAPTIKEEEVPAVYGNLKELILSLGGEVISDEMPRMMSLAYTMVKVVTNVRNKFNTAYFGWVKFYMKPEKVLELKAKLDLDPEFVRFLITKTVKENTIAAKRFVRDDMSHRKAPAAKKDKDAGPAPEINKEEIDKEIDAMVAV